MSAIELRKVCCSVLVSGLLIALQLTAVAHAQVHRLRVRFQDCDARSCQWQTAYCSCVAIGRYQPGKEIFASAAHCVQHANSDVAIEIDGHWRTTVVLARAKDGIDLALLGVNVPGEAAVTVTLAANRPQPGTTVVLRTYPRGGALQVRNGELIASRYPQLPIVVDRPSVPGESGGAVLLKDGRLAGIVSATGPMPNPRLTLASGPRQLRQLIRDTFQADPPGEYQQPSNPQSSNHGAEPTLRVPTLPGVSGACSPPNCACQPCPGLAASVDIARLRAELNALRQQLARLEQERSHAPPASDDEPSQVAWQQLDQRLRRLEQLKIPVQILAADGRIIEEAAYPLGEPIPLRLIPKRE